MQYSYKRFFIVLAVIFGAQAHAGMLHIVNKTAYQGGAKFETTDVRGKRNKNILYADANGFRNYDLKNPKLIEITLMVFGKEKLRFIQATPSAHSAPFNSNDEFEVIIDKTGPETFEYTFRNLTYTRIKGIPT